MLNHSNRAQTVSVLSLAVIKFAQTATNQLQIGSESLL